MAIALFGYRPPIVLLALMMPALVGCNESYQWRQKLIVTVDTPEGEVSGSSVVEVNWRKQSKVLADMAGARHGHKGEATVVELPGGRYLFALLNNADFIALRTFAPDKLPRSMPADVESFLPAAKDTARYGGERMIVARDSYPALVTFDRVSDPTSVRQVDPGNLAAVFGPGYALKAITLVITDEKVTESALTGILRWLNEHPEPGLCAPTGRSLDIPVCRQFHHGDFVRK